MLEENDRLQLIKSIKHFIQVAWNSMGTFVLQTLVQAMNSKAEEEAFLSKVRAAGVHNLAKNQNSVHEIGRAHV